MQHQLSWGYNFIIFRQMTAQAFLAEFLTANKGQNYYQCLLVRKEF